MLTVYQPDLKGLEIINNNNSNNLSQQLIFKAELKCQGFPFWSLSQGVIGMHWLSICPSLHTLCVCDAQSITYAIQSTSLICHIQ